MALWAIGDPHGELRLLDRLLDRVNPDLSRDALLFLGDYINRGDDSFGVLHLVDDLRCAHPKNVIALVGNHEAWFLDVAGAAVSDNELERRSLERAVKAAGAYKTLAEFIKMPREEQNRMLEIMAGFDLCYEGRRFIAAHAPLPECWGPPDSVDSPEMAAAVEACLSGTDTIADDYEHHSGKLVICGHTRRKRVTLYGNPFAGGMLVMDTGAGTAGSLSACNIDSLLAGEPEIVSVNQYKAFTGKLDVAAPAVSAGAQMGLAF